MRILPALWLGSGDRDRTCDTRLMSPLLCQLSYAAVRLIFTCLSYHTLSRGAAGSFRAIYFSLENGEKSSVNVAARASSAATFTDS